MPYKILKSAPAPRLSMSVAAAAVALRVPSSSAYAAIDRLLEEDRRAPGKR